MKYLTYNLCIALLFFFCTFSIASTEVQSVPSSDAVAAQFDLTELMNTTGGNFIIMGNARGETRVLSRTPANITLSEIHANSYKTDTQNLIVEDEKPISMSASTGYYFNLVKTTESDFQQGIVGQQLPAPLGITVLDENDQPVANTDITFSVTKGGATFLDGSTVLITTTDSNGQATAAVILGTDTSANPVGWLEDGKNTQQVGLNVVVCHPTQDPTYKMTFSAYAFPDQVVKIKKHDEIVDHNGARDTVISFAGHYYFSVRDQYDNPVSNVPVTIKAGDAAMITPDPCPDFPNKDNRPALIVPFEAFNVFPRPFSYEQNTEYSGQNLVISSDYTPSNFIAFTGGSPNYIYDINLTTPEAGLTLTLETQNRSNLGGDVDFLGNCSGDDPPSSQFYVYIAAHNEFTFTGKPKDNLLFEFGLIQLIEEDELLSSSSCGGCEDIVGKAKYYHGMNAQDITLTVNGTPIPVKVTTDYGPVYTVSATVADYTGYFELNFNLTEVLRARNKEGEDCYCTTEEFYDRDLLVGFYLAPLIIELDPAIIISLDEQGNALCDTEVNYTISDEDYSALTGVMTIYENGDIFAEYPIDTETMAPVIINQGVQFDATKTYTADIRFNNFWPADSKGESSDPVELTLQQDVSIKHLYVENEKENVPVMQGKSVSMLAETNPASLASQLEWSVHLFHEERAAEDQILVEIDKETGELTVYENSGSGKVMVRASYSDCIYKEEIVEIGCQSCESGGCPAMGSDNADMGSVDFSISLGNTTGGDNAGSLTLQAENISTYTYNVKSLKLNSLIRESEVIRDIDGSLRQIVTGKTLVDFIVESETSYSINMYHLEAKGPKINNVYMINGGFSPYVSYKIEDPDPASTVVKQLKISKIRGSETTVTQYTQDTSNNSWTLSHAGGASIITRTEQESGDTIIRTEQVEDADGVVSSIIERTYKTFEWGESIVRKTVDPSGANLQTLYQYYEDSTDEGSYSKIESITYPTGSWEYFTYDSLGRIGNNYSSWLDLSISQKSLGLVKTYNYDTSPLGTSDGNLPKDVNKPRKITATQNGITVSLDYYAYNLDSSGQRVEIYERAASQSSQFGATGNQRTVTTYYAEDLATIEAGLVKSTISSDGQVSTYEYEAGSYDSSSQSFSAGVGDAERRTITHTTEDSPTGIAYKTTRDIQILDEFGSLVSQQTQVYNGSDYVTIRGETTNYDAFGRSVGTISSNGTSTEQTWSCCGKETETDTTGVTSRYEYDDLNRVEYISRDSLAGEIVSQYEYDASGRRTKSITSAQALSLASESAYDKAGRIKTSKDSRNLTTTYSYENGGLITTVTRPGGATEITTSYSDGSTKSITGTGVVPQYYSYGINSDGTRYTTVTTGSASSPSQHKTTTDFLGRTAKVTNVGFTGIETTTYYYNDKGWLTKTSSPGIADTLYEYNELGEQTRSGLDINGNGSLDNVSDDRISAIATSYQFDGNSWWQTSEQSIFPESGVGISKVISKSKVRLSGFDSGLIGETISTDIHANQTTTEQYLDKNNHQITEITNHPGSVTDATTLYSYGLLTSMTDLTGITTSYSYDALGRKTGSTDPRTGQHVIHYNAKGEVDYTQDPANNRTLFTYDSSTGRNFSTTDAKDRTTYFLYNNLGNITHTWGATYPVRYEYDTYGRMVTMHTYQVTEGWNSPAWPVVNNTLSSKTHFHYHEASGLLKSKEDADGNQTSYTYYPGGKLQKRTWARQADSANLDTNYSYDGGTGQLTGIDYSDTTADISFNYHRTGNKSTIVDSAGTRTFSYTANLQPESESLTGLLNYTLTRNYADSGLSGRYSGFTVGSDYAVDYGYDNTGRFDSVSWNIADNTDSVQYGYLPNSHLLSSVAFASGAITTYGYETNRNVKTEVLNAYNTTTISQYSYEYDEIGRRTSMTTTGEVFDTPPLPVSPDTALEETLVTYQADDLNQYSEIDKNGTTVSPLYDKDGNLTEDDRFTYSWNGENRLTSLTPKVPTVNGAKQLSFQYDYQGRRFAKTTSTWDGSAWQEEGTTLFIYDGWNLIQELNSTVTTTASYVYGLDLSQTIQGAGGVGGILSRIDQDANIAHAYFYDANGNVGQMVDTTDGSTDAHYEYDPFGNLTVSAGIFATENPFLFSSKYLDIESGLYYYGYRFYDPEMGRWVSRDPIQENGGLNLYAFVGNNSITYVDILGLFLTGNAKNYFYSKNSDWQSNDKSVHSGPSDDWAGNIAVGVLRGGAIAIAGTFDAGAHPIETTKALIYAAGHLDETVEAIAEHYSEKAQTYTGKGEIVFDVLTVFVATAKAKQIKDIAQAGNLTKELKKCKIREVLKDGGVNKVEVVALEGLEKAQEALGGELVSLAKRSSNRQPAVTVGAHNPKTGLSAADSSHRGVCAEVGAAKKVGGNSNDVVFTMPVRSRTGKVIPVCKNCQKMFDKKQFPAGTPFIE